MKIATITMNPSLDRSVTVDQVVPEKKLRCSRARHEPGGGGINVARALRELGEDSLAIYPAGGDTGRYLSALIEGEGISHRSIPIQGWTRLNMSVEETATQQDYRFVMPGPDLSPAEWQACIDAVTSLTPQPQYIVASGSLTPGMPDDFYARLARHAKQHQIRFILDTSGAPLEAALQEGVFLTKPNLNELRKLAADELNDPVEQTDFVRSLVSGGRCEVVLASLGPAGAMLATDDQIMHLRSPTVPIRSRVGAGDCTVAGIVLSLMQGHPIREAALYGIAAGTAAVMTPGSQLCRRDDVEHLYEMMLGDPTYVS
jgi:6-phosphofructokinase 2